MSTRFMFGSREDAPILLLHGILGTFESEMAPLVPFLERDRFLIGADFRMHGSAAGEGSGITLDGLCDDALAAMDAHGIESAHVAGYSLGGFVGLALAHRRPERVKSVLLHATKFYWTADNARGFADGMRPDRIEEKQPRWAARLATLHGGEHWRVLCEAASDFVLSLPGQFTETEAAGVHCPVRVSVGDRDELVSIEECAALYRVLPAGSLSVLANTRHPFGLIDLAGFADMILGMSAPA
ncbi:MAG: alpha/beta fold hydrolase [Ignavibacteria bacterium]|nr:alpha/beta fold hydrolase [Ignavibacteria bacterium]